MKLVHCVMLAALVAAEPVMAHGAPADDSAKSDEIVVKGVRERDREVRRYVDALTDTLPFGQIGKFEEAVCPAGVGLPEAQNARVAARLRQVAAAVGMKVAEPKCRPNTFVIVVSDPAEFIPAMKRKYPAFFNDPLGNRAEIPKRPGAATAWHVEGRVDRDGQPLRTQMASADSPGGYQTTEMTFSSRFSTSSRPVFLGGVLVVDRQALAGLTVTQLADYAAMRLYARTDPADLANSSAPTILKAIDAPMDSPVPITLTSWDLSFLKALYASAPDRYAKQQRNDMRRRVSSELNGKEDD